MSARVIHHFAAGNRGPKVHTIPAGSRILGAAMRRGAATVYVELPVGAPPAVQLHVMFVGTGWDFDPAGLDHIATVQDGPFIWHVYAAILS